MRGGIGGVGILIGTAGSRNLLGESMRHIFVVFRRVRSHTAGADDDFCSISAQQAAFLFAHLVCHHKNAVIALDCGGYSNPMPVIATGRLTVSAACRNKPIFSQYSIIAGPM